MATTKKKQGAKKGLAATALGALGRAAAKKARSLAGGAVSKAARKRSSSTEADATAKPVKPSKATPGPAKRQKASAAAASTKTRAPRPAARATDDQRPGVGARAPSFVLTDDSGATVSSESLRGKPYVLYFYPKDDTPGCTAEACGFRDSLPRFTKKGVKVLGVSPDPVAAHQRFKRKYGLNFPLLSDPDKTLANAYGVWVMKQNYGREYMGIERSTFVIDDKGVIRTVYRGVRVPGHIDTVLGAL